MPTEGPREPAGLGSAAFLGLPPSWVDAGRRCLNLATYYQMKQRAGRVGERGLAPVLNAVVAPGQRLHLAGPMIVTRRLDDQGDVTAREAGPDHHRPLLGQRVDHAWQLIQPGFVPVGYDRLADLVRNVEAQTASLNRAPRISNWFVALASAGEGDAQNIKASDTVKVP